MGVSAKRREVDSDGGLGKVFLGEPTFELDFEECFGAGQCRPNRSGVELK